MVYSSVPVWVFVEGDTSLSRIWLGFSLCACKPLVKGYQMALRFNIRKKDPHVFVYIQKVKVYVVWATLWRLLAQFHQLNKIISWLEFEFTGVIYLVKVQDGMQ